MSFDSQPEENLEEMLEAPVQIELAFVWWPRRLGRFVHIRKVLGPP